MSEALAETLESDGWEEVIAVAATLIKRKRKAILSNASNPTEGTLLEEIKSILAMKQFFRLVYQEADVEMPPSVTGLFE